MDLNYPIFFYKYLPQNTQFFDNHKLRATQRDSLNDPFEQSPANEKLIKELTPEEIAALHIPLKNNHQYSNSLIQKLLSRKKPESPNDDFESGTICFSETYDNLLMWSHYASEHQGFVIGMDPQHFLSQQRSKEAPDGLVIRRVTYRESRPVLQASGFHDLLIGTPHAVLATKSTHWSYEQEWRIQHFKKEKLSFAEGGDHQPIKDSYNKRIQLYEIPKESVKVLIIGARCAEQNLIRLKANLIGNEGWNHLVIKLAVADPIDFRLRFINLKIEDLPNVSSE